MNDPATLAESHGAAAETMPTVLVVDDSPDNLALIVELLRPHYKVKVAASGARALKIVRSDAPPQLVLLDIMMPEMDGYEVCRQLKADAATRNIPVIFLTALTQVEDEARGLALGAVDYITKPVSPPILLARVKNHLALQALHDLDVRRLAQLTREKELLEKEQAETERLMLSIFPRAIAERLRAGESNISGYYPNVTVLFSDLVGFTALSAERSPTEVVDLLNDLFSRFDHRTTRLGLEKIKTIGDAYMVAAGVPIAVPDPAQRCAEMALGMWHDLADFNESRGLNLTMRAGMHTGPVVAGVIGSSKFSYDLWGNTVNIASRMETMARVGCIQVSAATRDALGSTYNFEENPPVEVKGTGLMITCNLLGRAIRG